MESNRSIAAYQSSRRNDWLRRAPCRPVVRVRMKLSRELLSRYCRLYHPCESTQQIEERAKEFHLLVIQGKRDFANYFVTLNDRAEVCAALSVFQLQPGVLVITTPKMSAREIAGKSSDVLSLIQEALERARDLKATHIHLRTEETPESSVFHSKLISLGFEKRHTRLEFKTDFLSLPEDTGSPMAWDCLTPIGTVSLKEASQILGEAEQGDPDADSEEDPLECLRGKGLGQWLHKHGFAMMKAQGGREYHDGTISTNERMIRLFYATYLGVIARTDEHPMTLF